MPDSEVIRTMRAFKRDLLAGERTQMAEMSRRWLAVERRLSGQMDALAQAMDTVRRDGGTVGMGQLFNDMRYRQLLIQLTNELERYTDYADRTIADRQRTLARLGIRHAAQAITTQGVSAGFARLPLEAVEFMVGNAGNGSPLRTLLVASWPDAADGLTQALVNGIALGYNPRKVAREMARGSTRSLDRMMVIARTESLRVYRHANLESYKASGVVTSYMRLATHDSRVCAACLLDEGHVYELGETMPEHPQGRCTLVPKVQGIPDPQWQKGEAWLREQPEATQRSILGKGRYEAWQNGEFDLAQLVTVRPNSVWGDSLQVTPLGQLAGMGRVAAITPVSAPGVPSFATVKEAEDWARENLSFASSVRYDGLQVETVNAINKHLADRLPQVSHLRKFTDGKLRSILTQESKGDWHMAMNQDTAILSINRKYDALDKWLDMWDRDTEYQERMGIPFSSKRYLPREKAITITLDHEIGHSVQWSLDDTQKRAWAKAARDAGRSGWVRPTVYAAKDKQEEFAEMFALYVNDRRDLLTSDMNTFFDDLLRRP